MAELRREGIRLFFDDRGHGQPPLLLVHGWTCDHTYLAPQRDHFAPRHRVVSVDLRGHGASDKPPGPYSIRMFAEDLAWLCRQVGLERPVVIGHSMGGMAALELAALEPDLPAAIVAIDSPLVPSDELARRLRETAAHFRSPEWRPLHRAFLEQALFIPADDPQRKERILRDMTSAPDHVTRDCFDAIVAADTAAAASRCRVPFLYIAAAVLLSDLPRLRQLCPRVVTAQTACAGHFAQLEVPDQVNAMIERFLATEVVRSG